jgi:O-antigen/teichoic acid export membrane protein
MRPRVWRVGCDRACQTIRRRRTSPPRRSDPFRSPLTRLRRGRPATAPQDPIAPPPTPTTEADVSAPTATTGRSVLRGGLWYVASSGVPQAYTLVISVVAARFLGPSGMGVQSFIAFVSLTTTTVLTSSLFVALVRHIGESVGQGHPEALHGLLTWAWRIEGAAALVGAAVFAGAVVLGADPEGPWLIAGVVTAFGVLHAVPSAVLMGLQRFRQAATVGLSTGFVATVLISVVLWAGGGITGMFAVEAATGAVNLLWTGLVARRALNAVAPQRGAVGDLRRRVARYALVAGLGVLLQLVVTTRSEFFFLSRFSTHPQIAFYSIAFASMTALRLLPATLAGSISPAFATLFGAGEHVRIRSGYVRAFRLLATVSLPLAAAALALAPELVRLVYGNDYREVGRSLRILLAAFPLIALSALANAFLLGLGRVRVTLAANAVGAVIDVGLAAALVPVLDARGAALANAGGQGTYSLFVLGASARILGAAEWHLWTLARGVVAAAGGGAAGWAVLHGLGGVSGLLAGGIAVVAAYAALAVVLRVLAVEDAEWLERAVGGRAGGVVGRLCRLCASA